MSELKLQAAPMEPGQNIDQITDMHNAELNSHNLESLSILNEVEQYGIPVEDKEGIANSLDTLRTEFEIEDDYFNDPKAKLVMASIADRHNKNQKGNHSHGKKASEMEYIADLVMLAAGPHTKFAEQYEAAFKIAGISDERERAAFDKFTQPEVSRDMDEYIKGEEFDEIRKRLGIEKESPYEVHVLSIESERAFQSHGLFPFASYETEGDEQLSWKEWEAIGKENDYRREYVNGLKKNNKAMSQALGRDSEFGAAWVSTFKDGTKYLCVALPTAEKVLYPNEERADYYDEDARERDKSILLHEFTHTQEMLLFDNHVGLGISLEELRAEHFSGDRQGYTDIKRFFNGIQMLTGYTPKKSLEIDGAPYNEEAFLVDIAKNIGLEGLLDTMTAIPGNYAADEHASPYLKAIVAHNGGSLSSHFDNIYKRLVQQEGEAAVQGRINEYIDFLREHYKGNEFVSVESYLYFGGVTSLGRIGSENFRRRYPDESDGYDYEKPRVSIE